MMLGERFITNEHMPRNGGHGLTPDVSLIQAAETHGLLVAVDPHLASEMLFFKAHPSKAPPAKILFDRQDVPRCLLSDEDHCLRRRAVGI